MQFDGGADLGADFIDIELRWDVCHEDLDVYASDVLVGTNTFSDHGTAVLGEIIGYDNEYGVTGIAHDANARMVSVNGDPGTWPDVANSINTAAANLGAKIALVETGAGVANSVIKALNELDRKFDFFNTADFSGINFSSYDAVIVAMEGPQLPPVPIYLCSTPTTR